MDAEGGSAEADPDADPEDVDDDWTPPAPPRVTATEAMAWVTYAGVLGALIALAVTTGHPTLGVVSSFVVWVAGLAILVWYTRTGSLRTPEVVLERAPLPFPFADDDPVGRWLQAGAVGSPADVPPPPVVDPVGEGEDAGLAAYLARAELARRRRDSAEPPSEARAAAPGAASPGAAAANPPPPA